MRPLSFAFLVLVTNVFCFCACTDQKKALPCWWSGRCLDRHTRICSPCWHTISCESLIFSGFSVWINNVVIICAWVFSNCYSQLSEIQISRPVTLGSGVDVSFHWNINATCTMLICSIYVLSGRRCLRIYYAQVCWLRSNFEPLFFRCIHDFFN